MLDEQLTTAQALEGSKQEAQGSACIMEAGAHTCPEQLDNGHGEHLCCCSGGAMHDGWTEAAHHAAYNLDEHGGPTPTQPDEALARDLWEEPERHCILTVGAV